ncbi:uncharacterized protein [Clytia hemisphaerica]|uniref:uncharacterized protein n=1 Tax=Clytia hemisphaerica TaxID=252671 RepID=UPI0034D43DEF
MAFSLFNMIKNVTTIIAKSEKALDGEVPVETPAAVQSQVIENVIDSIIELPLKGSGIIDNNFDPQSDSSSNINTDYSKESLVSDSLMKLRHSFNDNGSDVDTPHQIEHDSNDDVIANSNESVEQPKVEHQPRFTPSLLFIILLVTSFSLLLAIELITFNYQGDVFFTQPTPKAWYEDFLESALKFAGQIMA